MSVRGMCEQKVEVRPILHKCDEARLARYTKNYLDNDAPGGHSNSVVPVFSSPNISDDG